MTRVRTQVYAAAVVGGPVVRERAVVGMHGEALVGVNGATILVRKVAGEEAVNKLRGPGCRAVMEIDSPTARSSRVACKHAVLVPLVTTAAAVYRTAIEECRVPVERTAYSCHRGITCAIDGPAVIGAPVL